MVALLGGQETIPGDPAFPITLTYEQVAEATQAGFGPSPAESQAIVDEAQRQRDIIAAADAEQVKRAELAIMEATAEEAHEFYYSKYGSGYGTTPGGPDVYYFDYGQAQPTTYEKGTFFGADLPGLPGKDDLLLYGALAIGALALLKR
jgi:hypothetical protein